MAQRTCTRQRPAAAATAALAAAALLTGCVGSDGGGGEKSAGSIEEAVAGSARPLTEQQARSVLPDAAAMPGRRARVRPVVERMDGESGKSICPETHRKGCDGGRFHGVATFVEPSTNTQLDFWLIAYRDERSAENAYDTLWDWFGRGVGIQPERVSIGAVGQERTARRGVPGTEGSPTAVAQIRVGATVLWLSTANSGPSGTGTAGGRAAKSTTAAADERLKALAGLFAGRAQQAERGETPSARLGG
ncbi:hypothetical protein [Streptomyces sp. NPDC002889]|uniref:hypothetical protein n=1 Tax=Streptomyces sp. NPDC002889 TaxID=3364669 RepID=UPI003687701D